MVKKRIVAAVVVKSGIVVQSIGFSRYLPVGSPEVVVENLNRWGADEIIVLDIDATLQGRRPNSGLVASLSEYSSVPLTMGGGISSVDDIRDIVHHGADKVAVNSWFLDNPDFVREASAVFGNQCIVVSIDARRHSDGSYVVYRNGGSMDTGRVVAEVAVQAEEMGAGEILINSIDRDGSKLGYDLNLIHEVSHRVGVPVIACGGVGTPEHILEGLEKSEASACAVGNMFHFSEHAVTTAKAYLRRQGYPVRISTHASYAQFEFDPDGRPSKIDDDVLESLRFEHFPEEII